jgi:hypothetical protein
VPGQVLAFVFGDCPDAMLPLLWADVPADYRDKLVYFARCFRERLARRTPVNELWHGELG